MIMIHFEVKGIGKTVVFIHGFMENNKIWNDFASILSETHQVVTLDLAGHGKSQNYRSINTMEDFAEDVIEVLNHLNIVKATFIGHSMGGYICLAIADLFSQYIEKLILVNSTSLPDSKEKKVQRLKVIPTIHRNFPLFVKLSIPMLFSDELRPLLINELNILKDIALETSIEGIEAALKGMRDRLDRTAIFYDLNYPILILNGIKDKTIDIELFKTIIPERENITVKNLNCAHVIFMEQKEEFSRLITEFI